MSTRLWAAACCGGGFAAPSIIAGDDKAQFSASYSHSEVVVDNVDANGFWRKGEIHQHIQTLRLEGAQLLSDRWQWGLTVPVIERARLDQKNTGLGDVSASLAYEYLPDWDYNLFRPKGIGYLQFTYPTGLSKAESEIGGLDSRGNGFLALGVGTLLSKSFGPWDVFSTIEIHHSFEKSVSNTTLSGRLKPGNGGQLGLGGGLNTTNWRWGAALTWSFEDSITFDSSNALPPTGPERFATAALSASYLASNEWAGTLSYADQTLFGRPLNTSLGRSLSLQLQRRWGR